MKEDRPADVVLPDAGPSRFLQLHFLDHDPEEGWAEGYAKIGEAIDASGLATHVWTSPVPQHRLRHRHLHRRALVVATAVHSRVMMR